MGGTRCVGGFPCGESGVWVHWDGLNQLPGSVGGHESDSGAFMVWDSMHQWLCKV